MPCMDGGPPARKHKDTHLSQIQLEAVLCGFMSAVERQNVKNYLMDSVDWDEVGVPEQDVHKWWKRHKIQDEKRRARDREEAARVEAQERRELARLQAKYL